MKFDTRAIRPDQIKKETLRTSLQQPAAVYPTVMGILGGAGVTLFGSSPVMMAALAGCALLAGVGWAWEFFGRGDTHANRYLERYRKGLETQRKEAINRLRQEFINLQVDEGSVQLTLFQRKFENFNHILNRKLQPGELTYNRYLATAEQVYLNGLDNLEKAALALQSVAAIDSGMLNNKLQALQARPHEEVQETRDQIEERLMLHQTQHQRVRQLLEQNEAALTRLDQVSTQLANTDLNSGKAAMDMEQAMGELTRLIENAQQYAYKQ
ncbi:hypothetical protein [Marinobacter sp. SS21]|uniref:hypothetical protein n=1 Tax=Marinobacter sp. SS21 TaxID=2979460 RepID=UPI00232FD97F|nr:hypothetical protein [Marinobacter sp. SS21]MDC0662920.1 hypothetical protein [Marinobacter sp. SS21]